MYGAPRRATGCHRLLIVALVAHFIWSIVGLKAAIAPYHLLRVARLHGRFFIDLDPEAPLTESKLVSPRHCGKAMNRTSTAIFSDRARSTSAVISKSASALMLTATDDSEYRCC
jgi:hypothetical protein